MNAANYIIPAEHRPASCCLRRQKQALAEASTPTMQGRDGAALTASAVSGTTTETRRTRRSPGARSTRRPPPQRAPYSTPTKQALAEASTPSKPGREGAALTASAVRGTTTSAKADNGKFVCVRVVVLSSPVNIATYLKKILSVRQQAGTSVNESCEGQYLQAAQAVERHAYKPLGRRIDPRMECFVLLEIFFPILQTRTLVGLLCCLFPIASSDGHVEAHLRLALNGTTPDAPQRV